MARANGRERWALLLLLLVMVANLNTLFYRTPPLLSIYPAVDTGALCFGLFPAVVGGLQVLVVANNKLECKFREVDVFESLEVKALLPPGAYVIRVGGLYISTQVPRLITLYVEDGMEGAELRALLLGNGRAYELVVKDGNAVRVFVLPGDTRLEIWMYLNATSPTMDVFRIGAYLNSQGGGS